MSSLNRNLVAALAPLARITGGIAMLSNADGNCLHAVDHMGQPRPELVDAPCELCQAAIRSGATQTLRDTATQVERIAIPFEDGAICTSNGGTVEYQRCIFETLKETLPLIASVAGGEAVLIGPEGQRTHSADPDTSEVRLGSGAISEYCREVMETGRPAIGPSMEVPGAMAVRIPFCKEFGFGFNNAKAVRQREALLDQVKRGRSARYTWDDIVGDCPRIQETLLLAKRAAASHSTILMTGESGTGKELFSQAIHNASDRSEQPFIALNCSAIPESLVESTLFGYAPGTFTGAQRGGKEGLFEQANGGTLLLDEISEMPLESQAKLLRVLQEKEVCRLGSARPVPIDVRIISTSNVDMAQCAADGTFRSDLYYRLNVIDIHLPPLRERMGDIEKLASAMLARLFHQGGRYVRRITPDALAVLLAYDWPGNLRELHNALERAVYMATGDSIELHHLPPNLQAVSGAGPGDDTLADAPRPLATRIAGAENQAIIEVLRRNNGNRTKSAEQLGISVTTLWRRMKKLRIAARDFNV
jgi:DNA-binding NtrC family response regulator